MSDTPLSAQHFETLAIHAGQEPDPTTGAVMTPIYQTSTYVQAAPDDNKGYEYSRTDNPTRKALEDCLAALEGSNYGLAFSSGMAAIDNVFKLLAPGDHVVATRDVYGGTFRLADKIWARYGINFSWIDVTDLEAVKAALRPETRLIWLETPTNPGMGLADIQAISALAKAATTNGQPRPLVAVDNTFASPALQQPLAFGADLVMHSTTKYLGGHSDVVGGALIVSDEALFQRLKFLQNAAGAVPGPQDCFLLLRGLKTLALRMERHSTNGMAVAQFMSDHPAFTVVNYPGLRSHPQRELARRQMHGSGGMVSAIMRGGAEAGKAFVSRTRLFALAESLGRVERLIEYPSSMT